MPDISPVAYILGVIVLVIRIVKDIWDLIDRWRRRK